MISNPRIAGPKIHIPLSDAIVPIRGIVGDGARGNDSVRVSLQRDPISVVGARIERLRL